MRRREFIAGLGGAAAVTSVSWPLAARAQQPALPVIGFLNSASPDLYANPVRAFHQGLSEAGYVERQNVAIEYRWANNQYDRLPALAAELVDLRVAVIAANGPAARVAKEATATIPIVFSVGFDPLKLNLVTSLSRPGGNLTGASILNAELEPKRLELLREIVPTATVVALLVNPANLSAEIISKNLQVAAGALGLQLHVLNASTESDLPTVFATLPQLRVGALLIVNDPFLNSQAERLAALTLRYAMPTIFQYREFAAAGGLMSYGGSLIDAYRLMGIYTGRILKGEKPADLPVQQSTKVELIINLKTAKAFGLTVPLALLGRADEVIE